MFDQLAETERDLTGAAGGKPATDREPPPGKLPVLVIMHGEHSCPGRVGQLLRRKGHVLDVRKPRFGDALPATLEQHAGAVIFGGPMSANDTDDYIRTEIDWIAVPLRENKPLFGICLGAQMLTRHLGSAVAPHRDGRVEIGYCRVEPTRLGSAIGAWPEKFYHWHREGFGIPAGGECLATGADFPNQAYRFGSAYGVQFHPEITYQLVNRWTTCASQHLTKPGAQPPQEQLMGHIHHGRRVKAWLDLFLDRWLAAAAADDKAPRAATLR